jgi:spore germination cell wall hydrolase CwlJ-like protein
VKDAIKRWITYIIIFVTAVLLTNQYNEYNNLEKARIEQQQFVQQEKNCIKNALYYEARSEGLIGILAVASVIENRKNSGKYPSTYCEVINQHKQFSYTLEGKRDVESLEQRLLASDKKAYGDVSEVAHSMLNGDFKPVLPAEVLWYAKTSVQNYWTKTKKVVTRVGEHAFYKDKPKSK